MNKTQPTPLDIKQAGKLKELGLCKDARNHILKFDGSCEITETPYAGRSDKTLRQLRKSKIIGYLPSSDECWPLILEACDGGMNEAMLKISCAFAKLAANLDYKFSLEDLAAASRQTLITSHEKG